MHDKILMTHGRTSSYRLGYRITWLINCPEVIWKGEKSDNVDAIFSEIASKHGFSIVNSILNDDKVTILISSNPNLSVTNIVKWLKGESARRILVNARRFSHDEFLKVGHVWQPGYTAESIDCSK